MQLSGTVRESILNSIDEDIGTSSPEVRFYVTGGATPANSAATITLNNPAFLAAAAGTATSGQMDLNTATTLQDTTPAGNASPVTRLCFYTGSGAGASAWLLQLGIATSGTPDITMSNNTIATTDTVQLTSLRITCPEGSADAS